MCVFFIQNNLIWPLENAWKQIPDSWHHSDKMFEGSQVFKVTLCVKTLKWQLPVSDSIQNTPNQSIPLQPTDLTSYWQRLPLLAIPGFWKRLLSIYHGKSVQTLPEAQRTQGIDTLIELALQLKGMPLALGPNFANMQCYLNICITYKLHLHCHIALDCLIGSISWWYLHQLHQLCLQNLS